MAKENNDKNLKNRFRWEKEEKITNLIQNMLEYKTEMEFEGKDFCADKVKLYECLRQKMAKIYKHDKSSFGPSTLGIVHTPN